MINTNTKMTLAILIMIPLFSSLVLGALTDPVGEFGGIGNRVEITDVISLSSDKDHGDYTSEILDAGKIVIWDKLDMKYAEFHNKSSVKGTVAFVGADKTFTDHAVRINFKSRRTSQTNQDYLNGIFTKLRIEEDGKVLPYWIDESSENLDIWVKLNISEGQEKRLLILYGDDDITYDPDCSAIFILCDNNIYNKLYSEGGDNNLISYSDLGIWEKKDLGDGVIQITEKQVFIYYKVGQSIEGGSATISTHGEELIDNLDFIYWSQNPTDKTDYTVHQITTQEIDDDLTFNFSGTAGQRVYLTDILVSYTNGSPLTGGIGLEDNGITIQARACEDKDCIGSEFENITDSLDALPQSRYIQYKLFFEKKDFTLSVSKVIFSYEESTLPNLASDAITDAMVAIAEIEELGINASSAQTILDSAIELQEKGEFNQAISVAKQANEESDKLYEKYLADQEIDKEKTEQEKEQERLEKKSRAEEVMELAQLGIDTADKSHPDTIRAQTMLSQAQLAYNIDNYDLAIERSQDALDILSGREPVQPEPPNILGIVIVILFLIIIAAVIYSFVKAKLDTEDQE